MADGKAITVTGVLDRWQEYGDKGWGRGQFVTADGDRLTVVGVVPGLRPGDSVELTGAHETHAKFGAQFCVTAATVRIPDSVDGAVKWIAHHLPQIGQKRARSMIEHFGGLDKFWAVVESDPDRLAEIPGITAVRALEIQSVYKTVQDSKEHGSTLRAWGLTESQIARCMAVFGRELVDVVEAIRARPYDLYRCVRGFGWITADAVARRSGIPVDSPMRIASALQYVLETHTETGGHVFMVPKPFQDGVCELLRLKKNAVMDAIDFAVSKGEIVRRANRLYTARMERIELELAQQIVRRGGLIDAYSSDRKSNGRPAFGPGSEDLPADRGVDPLPA